VPAGGQGGVQVIIQQPADGGVAVRRVIGGCQGAGVLAEQVVQAVAAASGLGEQVLIVEAVEVAAGCRQVGVVEGGGAVGVDVRARVQAEPPEQPLLASGEVLVGQVERGSH
jgi:hypothetical protein